MNIFGCQQPRNYTGYCDRLVTRDLVNASQTLDDARRVGLLNRVDVRLARAVPAIPLFQTTFLDARKTSVRGVVPNGFGSDFWDIGELVARGGLELSRHTTRAHERNGTEPRCVDCAVRRSS